MGDSFKSDKAYELSMKGHEAFDREDYQEAFWCWTTAQKMDDSYEGSGAAQTNIGYLYENGLGVEKNEQEAIMWYQKAADNGCPYGLKNLAHCYYDGIGVDTDYEEAFDLFQQLAEDIEISEDAEWQEVYFAQYMLGYMCENGLGGENDMNDALFWYATAASNGQENAEARLIELAQESMETLYITANQFYDGKEEEKDLDIAFLLYKTIGENSVAKNNRELAQIAYAQYSVGWMYEHGESTDVDTDTAKYWYQTAADNGNEDAANRLEEINGSDNARKSAELLSRKAKKDLDFTDISQIILTEELLRTAQGLCDDYEGSAYDQWILGQIYNNKESLEWYTKSALQNFDQAQYYLGDIYYTGKNGVDVDKEKAFSWYMKAAQQGHADAQFNVGLMYVKGEGVGKDLHEGIKWLRKAVANGSEDAKRVLKKNGLTF